MEVAIFEAKTFGSSYDEELLTRQVTKWSEISEEEYKYLEAGINNLRYNTSGKIYRVIRRINTDTESDCLSRFIENGKFLIKRQEEYKKKNEARAKKAQKTKEQKKKERELKQLAELKNKYEK